MNMTDERLDELLKSRRMEAPRPDLAQQIILKARAIPQKSSVSLWEAIQQMFTEFHLAKPAYVLVGTLIVGLLIGFSDPSGLRTASDSDNGQVQSFLYADEGIL
ncbi:MAG TPA: hypothetical protein VIB79_27810 [Candidatus Binatia bacterium]|jgi:hypothetical protein